MPMKEITHFLYQNLTALIRHLRLFSPHEKLVIGVSGGTDSLALAHILADLCHNLQLEIHIATFNHGLRPEATAETQLVGQLAQTLNIPYTIGQGDVLAIQSTQKLSLEEAARKARYQFLADVAQKIGASTIVTAHHQDDQAETVLFQLTRGTGSTLGMRWIAPCPYAPHLRLVRPLLTTSRKQLELYCAENGLTPIFDPSNDDVTITRNAIRHQIMPLLANINPQVSSAFARFADIHAESQDALHNTFITTILPHITQVAGKFFISREQFRDWHVAYQRKLFTYLLDDIPNMTYDHIAHAIHIGMMGENGAIAQFPQGWQLRVMYDNLVLEHYLTSQLLPNDTPLLPENSTIPIKIGEFYDFGGWQFEIKEKIHKSAVAYLTLPEGANLTLRTRRPQDRFAPKGMMGKHQSIKNWMINHKIPQQIRANVPILCANDQIIMILWAEIIIADGFIIDDTLPNSYSVFINYVTNTEG